MSTGNSIKRGIYERTDPKGKKYAGLSANIQGDIKTKN